MKKNIGKYILRYGWVLIIALGALTVSTFLDMWYPELLERVVDDVIEPNNPDLLQPILLGILTIGIGRLITQYIKEFGFDWIAGNVGTDLRRNLFIHIQGRDTSFFDKTNTGEIMARLKEDIDKIWGACGFISMLLIEVAMHTVIIVVKMMQLNPIVAIIPCVGMVFCGSIAIILERKLDKVYGDISEANAKLNTATEENIAGVRTVKAFAREKHEFRKFSVLNKEYSRLNLKDTETFAKYYPYLSFVTSILPFLVILVSGYFYINETMSIGEVTAFVAYSQNIVWPMEMLGWLTNSFSEAVASGKKLKKIYKEEAKIFSPANPVVLDKVRGEIAFENVGFHKEDMHEILSGITFNIPAGKTLGIMGSTGSGKSSVISLLERLYDVTEGSIKLDGVDIRELSVKQLRSSTSLVMQDVFLFSDTIAENVRIGERDTMDRERIEWACREAGASEFIEKMEDGYDTVIGERGVGLSGGQKQRISMARAFAKNNPILILDDSTSALDMETEREIQQNLKKLEGRTKIIIAHRISSVKNADEIIFLEGGKIAERGTHDELMKQKGLYYETYVSQYGTPDLAFGA